LLGDAALFLGVLAVFRWLDPAPQAFASEAFVSLVFASPALAAPALTSPAWA
jgi:hypothetical protein